MFTSRELNTFISVAEKMSIKLAAEDLNITSPAVCSMIKKLERRIDNKLFIFENNKMILTQYGKRIYSLTEGHFHTLKSLEDKMKNNKEIIKIFISSEYLFLSPFITNQFKKKSIEIILTSVADESTDIIIDDTHNGSIEHCEYHSMVSELFFYLIYDKNNTCKDVFIHSEYAHLINKFILEKTIDKLKSEVGIGGKLTLSSNITSMIEMVICTLGYAILPHTCSVLKCMFNSTFELITKKIDVNIPLYIYTHKRIDTEMIKRIFDDKN
ncbi:MULTISPECIES: LysR family transcriptional regulator [Serratia]|nr:LysR family transcriptional regulator [Serratia proteamaculans]SPZ57095.1 DNA-binding transcriptional regulator DsdC [Serratia quinivorans]CAI0975946.1 DNA-binding transcriptional regulator DsdC [Serratia proteamaculans]CAI1096832.1 DNA-binding transcriptional regulator DsdC [Serratia proteamaculans]CAI1131872.1 DNA-binding transcriptional regulator DsdC [Serratia proteamaculans]CAI1665249.1 DNA-binding transcriptional regulator DsdC [Serratia proteamaculans]